MGVSAGAGEGPIRWTLCIAQTMGPFGKAGRGGLWILPWSRESFLCPGFPCSLSGAPCPDAQSGGTLPQPLCLSRDKAKW